MSQSNYIAAAIAIAFVIYITVKGNLPKYLGMLTGSGGFQQDTASAGNKPEQVASADTNTGAGSQTANSGSSNSGSSSTDTNSKSGTSAAVGILQQVGGDPSTLLDGVHLFDLAGVIGA